MNNQVILDGDGEGYYSVAEQMKKITEETIVYDLNNEDLPALPDSAIPYELNLVEMPIFSKNKQVKDAQAMKYVFDERSDEYMRVVPSADPNMISNKIPQEFDEQIFYGLMRLTRKTGKMRIISDYPNLLNCSHIQSRSGKNLLRAKDSLQRLKHSAYVFNQCYYDPVAKANGADFIKRTKHLNLINSLETVTFEKFHTMKDGNEKSELGYHFGRHGNIREIFIVTLNEDLVKNLELKSFKYFKQEDLLAIENAVTRKLYIMLTKWRHWEKKAVITRRVKFLASRIPLSWKENSIRSTIQSLLQACEDLKSSAKIADYHFHNDGGHRSSTIDFCFLRDNLDSVNAIYGTETTGHEQLEIKGMREEIIEIKPVGSADGTGQNSRSDRNESAAANEISAELLISFISEEYREKVTLRRVITDALKKYTAEHIKRNILYTNLKSKGNYRGFLVKALENDWGLGLQEDQKQVSQAREKIENAMAESEAREIAKLEEKKKYWSQLSLEDQIEWQEKARRKFGKRSLKIMIGFAISMAWDARDA